MRARAGGGACCRGMGCSRFRELRRPAQLARQLRAGVPVTTAYTIQRLPKPGLACLVVSLMNPPPSLSCTVRRGKALLSRRGESRPGSWLSHPIAVGTDEEVASRTELQVSKGRRRWLTKQASRRAPLHGQEGACSWFGGFLPNDNPADGHHRGRYRSCPGCQRFMVDLAPSRRETRIDDPDGPREKKSNGDPKGP